MPIPKNWYKKFLFVIEIDGVARAEFARCSPFEPEAANVAYKEGGRLHNHNAPGTVTFPEITMERGACDDYDLWNWFKDTYDAAAGTGLVTPDLYRTFDVVQLNRKREEVQRWTVHEAYCRKFSSGDWDNDADEVRIESVVIQPDWYEPVPA